MPLVCAQQAAVLLSSYLYPLPRASLETSFRPPTHSFVSSAISRISLTKRERLPLEMAGHHGTPQMDLVLLDRVLIPFGYVKQSLPAFYLPKVS